MNQMGRSTGQSRCLIQIAFPRGVQTYDSVFDLMNGFPGLLAYIRLSVSNVLSFAVLFREEKSLRSFCDLVSKTPSFFREVRIREVKLPAGLTVRGPVFIVGAPRSGSTMLFEALASCPNVWTIGGEDHTIMESIYPPTPVQGNRLDSASANPQSCSIVDALFLCALRNRDGDFLIDRTDRPADAAHVLGLLE